MKDSAFHRCPLPTLALTPLQFLGTLLLDDGAIKTSNRILATREVKERMAGAGIDAAGGTPEEFGKFIRDEIAKWGPVVKASGAKAD